VTYPDGIEFQRCIYCRMTRIEFDTTHRDCNQMLHPHTFRDVRADEGKMADIGLTEEERARWDK